MALNVRHQKYFASLQRAHAYTFVLQCHIAYLNETLFLCVWDNKHDSLKEIWWRYLGVRLISAHQCRTHHALATHSYRCPGNCCHPLHPVSSWPSPPRREMNWHQKPLPSPRTARSKKRSSLPASAEGLSSPAATSTCSTDPQTPTSPSRSSLTWRPTTTATCCPWGTTATTGAPQTAARPVAPGGPSCEFKDIWEDLFMMNVRVSFVFFRPVQLGRILAKKILSLIFKFTDIRQALWWMQGSSGVVPPISIVLFTPYEALISAEYLDIKFDRH